MKNVFPQMVAATTLVMASMAPAWSQAIPTPASPFAIEQIVGNWQVVGVLVAGGPVQALVTNDPTYMGRRLSITPTRISWAAKGSARGESCETPSVQALGSSLDNALGDTPPAEMSPALRAAPAYTVACQEKDWGPTTGAVLAYPEAGRLALTWYDNAVLLLQPVDAK
ncbi:hypothetical protein FXN63_04420 [Pigmentiphaga aceris]|uniref:Lipocalin-like domain-containing protein n=1 Tax=Pigmentiphaga aceris TaxID=1940612 RepID=A0A5C0AU25_9BURK|nr:hypothetical protein [Pigmentiphaga aceris]QEI05164.1 hypothetical protein FXN63_04420 [Pigmentiphaga aceris]